ncbi:MAG TPA: DUF3237 domain-containing protein [Burkholderiales bacterium]|nr:DUF3237 domain-containing protein [Burkholderiales bacterium]
MQLRELLKAHISLAAPEELHEDHRGRNRRIRITGGRFSGERLSGEVLPGGADWQLVRTDGVLELDARYMLKTADGALIYVHNRGFRRDTFMRTTPRFETHDARYDWLNRTVCVASGVRHPDSVEIDVYEVL